MIRRRPGEPVKPNLVQPRVQKGGGSVGIWGCISARGAGCCKIYRGRVKAAEYLSIVQNELAASVDLLYQNEPLSKWCAIFLATALFYWQIVNNFNYILLIGKTRTID
jgi:hypothetical protein